MSPEKMIHMANQIAQFFRTQPETDRAGRVAAHLKDFWEPRMRAQLKTYVAGGGGGLDPDVLEAVARL